MATLHISNGGYGLNLRRVSIPPHLLNSAQDVLELSPYRVVRRHLFVDCFHTARHVRVRGSAYCCRSNQSETLNAAQSPQSYPDPLTGSLSDRAPTLQGLEDQNCNRSEA